MSMNNPLTPAGIEPATFLFLAQHLNHCATAIPNSSHNTTILSSVYNLSTQLHVSANAAVAIIRLDTVYQSQEHCPKHVLELIICVHLIIQLCYYCFILTEVLP